MPTVVNPIGKLEAALAALDATLNLFSPTSIANTFIGKVVAAPTPFKLCWIPTADPLVASYISGSPVLKK